MIDSSQRWRVKYNLSHCHHQHQANKQVWSQKPCGPALKSAALLRTKSHPPKPQLIRLHNRVDNPCLGNFLGGSMRCREEAIGKYMYITSYFCHRSFKHLSFALEEDHSQPTLPTSSRSQQVWNVVPTRASQNSSPLALLGVCCPILTPFRHQFNHSQLRSSAWTLELRVE